MTFILIGDKIRFIRKKLGLSQETLADGICEKSYISKIENNVVIPNEQLLFELKKKMGICEDAISPAEVKILSDRINDWYILIKNKQFEEANHIQPVLKEKVERSLDKDLQIFYNLFEIRLLIFENQIDVVKERFDSFAELVTYFSDIQKYYYLFFSGIYQNKLGEFKKSLKLLLEAENFGKSLNLRESTFYSIIAHVYTRLNCAPRAIVYGTIALEFSKNCFEKTDIIEIDGTLAMNYNRVGEYRRAEELLLNSLYIAKERNNKILMRIISHNLACVYSNLKFFDQALYYFNEALKLCKPDEYSYVDSILWISYTLIEKDDVCAALERIEVGLFLSKNFKDLYILLESIRHSLTLDNSVSLNYIENITLPTLIEKAMYLKAIEYVDLLKKYYKNKKHYKKALEYSEMAEDFYRLSLKGEI